MLLQAGDIVFNRTNSLDQIGKVALFRGWADQPVSFASYLVRLRCGARVRPEYLNVLLNSTYVLAWSRAEALPAIGQANLNPNRYSYLPICLPPVDEQDSIIAHIASETSKLDALRAATERTIALLKERRAALIAAAVTGKLDVQGAGRHIAVVAD
jgi:type I restriction enzyme, S subunit